MGLLWYAVKGFEGLYEISNTGVVRSLDKVLFQNNHGVLSEHFYKGRELKSTKQRGYLAVNLYKNGKMHRKTIHRLVAEAFIPNPLNLPCINHKDENKLNNNVENLEWCTNKYNMNYGTRISRASNKCKKPIVQRLIDGTPVFVWKSTKEASEIGGFSITAISQALHKKIKTHHGFLWEYF